MSFTVCDKRYYSVISETNQGSHHGCACNKQYNTRVTTKYCRKVFQNVMLQ